MRTVFGAALAALVMFGAAPAFAQSACPPAPPAPALPDGATAKPSDMQKAVKAYETWRVSANAMLDCEGKIYEAARSNPTVAKYVELSTQLAAIQDAPEVKDFFAKQDAYKAKTGPVVAVSTGWQKSVEAFNAKSPPPKK